MQEMSNKDIEMVSGASMDDAYNAAAGAFVGACAGFLMGGPVGAVAGGISGGLHGLVVSRMLM